MKNAKLLPTQEQIDNLLKKLERYESTENPIIYFKAVRVTLIALGYDEKWVDDEFRDMLEKSYAHCFEIFNGR